MTDDARQRAAQEMAALLDQAQGAVPEELVFTFDGRTWTPQALIRVLAPYLTDRRRARIEAALDGRTYGLATVVEGLVNTGNVSAVMRTAEALGVQPFHVITGADHFKESARTSQGAEKWLDVHTWATPADCVAYLKARGYRIAATHLGDTAVPIGTLDFSEPTALVFGNEQHGLSEELIGLVDVRCIVPTPGFTQSFNISVAAAVCLYHARQDQQARTGRGGDLSPERRAALQAFWYLKSVRHARQLLLRADG